MAIVYRIKSTKQKVSYTNMKYPKKGAGAPKNTATGIFTSNITYCFSAIYTPLQLEMYTQTVSGGKTQGGLEGEKKKKKPNYVVDGVTSPIFLFCFQLAGTQWTRKDSHKENFRMGLRVEETKTTQKVCSNFFYEKVFVLILVIVSLGK